MEILTENPLIIVAIILALLAFIAYKLSKTGNKKSNKNADAKVAKKEELNADENKSDLGEESQENIEKTEIETEKTNKSNKKKKLKRLKPEITKVYEKKQLQTTSESMTKILEEKNSKEEEILKSMQFVKSSNNVAKLKPLTASEIEAREAKILEAEMQKFENADNNLQEADFFNEKLDDSLKSSHFDRTRRLSKMIKNNELDDLFCSHISEKYMKMDDIQKHLRNCDEIQEKLFHRVAETLANSEMKVSVDDNGNVKDQDSKESKLAMQESKRRELLAKFMTETSQEEIQAECDVDELMQEEIDLSAKNILVVDAILKRKGKKSVCK